MKKNVVLLFLIVLVSVTVLVSCATKDLGGSSGYFTAEHLALNSFIDTDEYTIVGKVKGESTFVYYDAGKDEFIGDSRQYGYIYEHDRYTAGENFFIGTGSVLNKGEMPEAQWIAMLNANYKLLKAIDEMDADTIFTPTYLIETANSPIRDEVQYKVTATALAISINK